MTRRKLQQMKIRQKSQKFIPFALIISLANPVFSIEKTPLDFRQTIFVDQLEIKIVDTPYEFGKNFSTGSILSAPQLEFVEDPLKKEVVLENNSHAISTWEGIVLEKEERNYHFADEYLSFKNEPSFSFSIIPEPVEVKLENENKPIEFSDPSYAPSEELINWLTNSSANSNLRRFIQKDEYRSPAKETATAYFSKELDQSSNIHSLINSGNSIVKVYLDTPKEFSCDSIAAIKPVFFVSEEELSIKSNDFSASFEPVLLPKLTKKIIHLTLDRANKQSALEPMYDDLDSYFEYDFSKELECKKQNLNLAFSFTDISHPSIALEETVFPTSIFSTENHHAVIESDAFYYPKQDLYQINLAKYFDDESSHLFSDQQLSKDIVRMDNSFPTASIDKVQLATEAALYDLTQINYVVKEADETAVSLTTHSSPLKEKFSEGFVNSSNLSFHFEKTINLAKNFVIEQIENEKISHHDLVVEEFNRENIDRPLIEFSEGAYDLKPTIVLASNKKTDWKDLKPAKVNPKKESVKKGFFQTKDLVFHLDRYVETARKLHLLAEKQAFLTKDKALAKLENSSSNKDKAKLDSKIQEYHFSKEQITIQENNDIKTLKATEFLPNTEAKSLAYHDANLSFKIREGKVKNPIPSVKIDSDKQEILAQVVDTNLLELFDKESIKSEEALYPFEPVFAMAEDEKEGWKDLDPLVMSPNTENDLVAYSKAFDLTFNLEKQQNEPSLKKFFDAAAHAKNSLLPLTVQPTFLSKIAVKIASITKEFLPIAAPIQIKENSWVDLDPITLNPKAETLQKVLAHIQELSFNFDKYIHPMIQNKNLVLKQDEFNFAIAENAKKVILATNFSDNSLLSYDLSLKEIPFDIKPLTSAQETPIEEEKKALDFAIQDTKTSLVLEKEKIVETSSPINPEKYLPEINLENLNFDEKFAQSKPHLNPQYDVIEVPLAPANDFISTEGSFIDFIHQYRSCLVKNDLEAVAKNVREFIKPLNESNLTFQYRLNHSYCVSMSQDSFALFKNSIHSKKVNRKMDLIHLKIDKSSYSALPAFDQKKYFLDISRKLPNQFKASFEKTVHDTASICMNIIRSLPNIVQETKNYVELLAANEEVFDPNNYIYFDASQRKTQAFYQLMLEKKKFSFLGTLPSLRELKTHVLSSSFKSELEVIPTPDGESYYFSVKLYPQYPEELRKVPQNVIFVLDQSRTISEERFESFKKGIIRSIPYLNPEANFTIVVLNKHLDTLSHHFLTYDKESLELVKSFLDNINYSFTVAPQDYTRVIPFLKEKFQLNSKEFNTLILLSDGAAYKNYHFNKDKIADFCSKNKNLLQVYTVASGQDNYLGGLDMLAFHNHGQLVYSKTNTALPRQLAILVKNLRNPLANNLHISSIRNESDALEFYPSSGSFPGMYADQPLTIYGKTDRLQNIDLMVQGKLGNEWVNITQSINLRQAKKGDRELLRNCQMVLKKMHYFIETPDADET